MKAVISAIILLVIVSALVIANSLVLENIFNRISEELEDVEKTNISTAKDDFTKIFEYYKKNAKYISLTVKHSELKLIEESFCELLGACEAKNESDIIQIKSRLIGSLLHTRRLVGINIDSVL